MVDSTMHDNALQKVLQRSCQEPLLSISRKPLKPRLGTHDEPRKIMSEPVSEEILDKG